MSKVTAPRLHHLALTVTDVDASVRWYEDVFGIRFQMDVPHSGGVGKRGRSRAENGRGLVRNRTLHTVLSGVEIGSAKYVAGTSCHSSEMGELFPDKSRRGNAECPENLPKNTTLKSQKDTTTPCAPAASLCGRIR